MLNPAQVILPTLDRIRSLTGTMELVTRHGKLDILRESGGHTYATVMPTALQITSGNHNIHLASLPTVREMKQAANREKDKKAMAAIDARMVELGLDPEEQP